MRLEWNNTNFHGPKLVNIFLSIGRSTREIILFKRYLGLTIKETVSIGCHVANVFFLNCTEPLISVKIYIINKDIDQLVKG